MCHLRRRGNARSDASSAERAEGTLAQSINIAAYSDALVVLGTAGVVVPVVKRWGVSPVIAYLVAGAVLGPLGLGSLIGSVPLLYWVTVVDAKNVAGIGDLGVVFLLFLIGLELSFERLKAMRRLMVGLGGLQVLLSTTVLALFVALFGQTQAASIVIGGSLALSSTAIVVELLANQGRLSTTTGRASFAILLAQDLAVIPILLFVSIAGANQEGALWLTIGKAFLQAFVAVAIIILIGRMLLRPLFRIVAEAQSSELFIATILFVIVATGVIAAIAGLSMALGAFVAGLLLAETEYRKAIEATIEPFKGLLLGLFFFAVGMSLDSREIIRAPGAIIACVAGLITIKMAIVVGLARLFRVAMPAAVEAGLLLGPGGEFAFVAIGLASTLGVLKPEIASFALAVGSLSMILIPLLALLGQRLRPRFEGPKAPDPLLAQSPVAQSKHAIVVGFGRVGQDVATLLGRHGVPYTAIDHAAAAVVAGRGKGREVFFGDATNPDFLNSCGLMDAAGVVVTIHTQSMIDDIVRQVRRLRPDILIVSRARDAAHARHLYAEGVTDAVPETVEASLQLSEAALVGLGIPTGPVIASIHERRDEVRNELQAAAKAAGRNEFRGVRAKAPPPVVQPKQRG